MQNVLQPKQLNLLAQVRGRAPKQSTNPPLGKSTDSELVQIAREGTFTNLDEDCDRSLFLSRRGGINLNIVGI